jgi:hypothetical protein
VSLCTVLIWEKIGIFKIFEFGKYKKLLFPEYKKLLFFVPPPTCHYKVGGVIWGVRRVCHSISLREWEYVYYKSIKREVKKRSIYKCRCDERLQTKTRDLHVSHTLFVYYESMNRNLKIRPIYECRCVHLKIKTRLTNEKFASVKGESARMFIFFEFFKFIMNHFSTSSPTKPHRLVYLQLNKKKGESRG